MQLPVFKPSKTFIRKTRVPCFAAKARNAELPMLARRHIAEEDEEDEGFQIFLRGKEPRQISEWHRRWLHTLFEKEEIITAIQAGMKEYGSGAEWCGYRHQHQLSEDYDDIQKHGIVPYLVLTDVVVDEIEQRIICALRTSKDGNLEEHGVTIYSDHDTWKFAYSDYISDYIGRLDLGVERGAKPARSTNDPSFLYGRWVVDKEATAALMRERGESQSYIQSQLKQIGGLVDEFSEGLLRSSFGGEMVEAELLRCELKGKTLSLTLKYQGSSKGDVYKMNYVNDRLVKDGVVMWRDANCAG